MAEFFSFMKMLMVCGTVFFIVTLVLLSMPQSRLRYVGMEMIKWVAAIGLVLMVPLPIDVLPDVLPPITYIDDLGYIVMAIVSARSAMGDRRKRALIEEAELAELRSRSGLADSEADTVDLPAEEEARQ